MKKARKRSAHGKNGNMANAKIKTDQIPSMDPKEPSEWLFQNRNNIIMPGKGRKVSWHYYKATTDCKHWDDNFELIKWQL